MMERLTRAHYKASDGHYLVCSEMCEREDCTEECGHFDEAIERLADYEDTGLTPEEVLPKDKADEIALQLMRLADLESFCSYTRLRELAEADKDGRLAVLPCKVGDTLWVIGRDNVPRKMELEAPDIRTVCTDEDNLCMSTCNRKPDGFCAYRLRNDGADIGKTVFLTREEAERALEGRK